jgi:hypothetical protein
VRELQEKLEELEQGGAAAEKAGRSPRAGAVKGGGGYKGGVGTRGGRHKGG